MKSLFESKTWKAASIFTYFGMHIGVLLITAISPLVVISMGVTDFKKIAEHCTSFKPLANWLIGVGAFTFAISAFALLSILSKNRPFQIFMTVFLGLNAGFGIGILTWSFTYIEDRKDFFRETWDEMEIETKNLIQTHYSCCGFENHTDYFRTPPSCYVDGELNDFYWKSGCYDRMTSLHFRLPGAPFDSILSDHSYLKEDSKYPIVMENPKFHVFFASYILPFAALIIIQFLTTVLFVISIAQCRTAEHDIDEFPTPLYENNRAIELETRNDSRDHNGEVHNGTDASPNADVENKLQQKRKWYHKIPDLITSNLENLFYWIGIKVGTYPKMTIFLAFLLAGSFFIGLLQRLEAPQGGRGFLYKDSEIAEESFLLARTFGPQPRLQELIVVNEENILTKDVFKLMADIDDGVQALQSKDNDTYEELCVQVLDRCVQKSVLEFWSYNTTRIRELSTSDILTMLNGDLISPVSNGEIDLNSIMGDIKRSEDGKIVGAKALLLNYKLRAREDDWESGFIDIGRTKYNSSSSVYVQSRASLRIELEGDYFAEMPLIFGGFGLIFVYLLVMTGRFSLVEHRMYISLMGIVTAGLAMGSGIAFSASLGLTWSIVHLVTPFLIIGIGVDDMFIILQSWNIIENDPANKNLDLIEKTGRVLKIAGVSITVTSVTDLLAFAVGASSELAAFASFSVYVASSIVLLFIFQCTFFLGCTVLDQRRREGKYDACIVCFKHGKNYKPSECSQREMFATFFQDALGQLVQKLPFQIVVIILTAGVTGIMAWGFSMLEVKFEYDWYLSKDSYLLDFGDQIDKYFPGGQPIEIAVINASFYEEREKLHILYKNLKKNENIMDGSLTSWFEEYVSWMKKDKNETNIYAPDAFFAEEHFYFTVLEFISNDGQIYAGDVIYRGFKIIGSKFHARHVEVVNLVDNVDIIDSIKKDCDAVGFTGDVFPYHWKYFDYTVMRIIRAEVYRNIGIILLCVFVMTLPLLSSLQMSLWAIVCVVFTTVDVAGTMHFSGYTIETSTIITLLVTVGLAVDYAAHVAHKFLVLRGTRKMRARVTLGQIGPAVFNGGFSTFLALVLLSTSDLFWTKVFFTIFTSVIGYGLWNGLVFLPCILALIGPEPHITAVEAQLRQKHQKKKINQDSSTTF